jgi:thiamine monophosphate synthase
MYKKICVTNRALAAHPFEEQIARVLDAKPDMLILREKDLGEAEYEKLAAKRWANAPKRSLSFIVIQVLQGNLVYRRSICRSQDLPQ